MDVRKTGGVECAVWVNLSSGGRCPPHGSPSPLSFECPVWADCGHWFQALEFRWLQRKPWPDHDDRSVEHVRIP
jgi:hypothetical protein